MTDIRYRRRILPLLCAGVFCIGIAQALAAPAPWNTNAPEKAFIYLGKPIDPRCVTKLTSGDGGKPQPVDLAACTRTMRGKSKVTRDDRAFETEEPVEGGIGQTEFDSYEVLSQSGSRFVISTEWSGGGTGRFTDLMVVRKTGSALSVEKFLSQGGDRCNGGLDGVDMRGGTLRWSVNITPYDLVGLGGLKSLKAYEDLETSATSCVATQSFEYDLDTGAVRFSSVTLQPNYGAGDKAGLLKDQAGWTERYTYQHCFNLFYNGYVSRGHIKLSPSETKAFANGFVRACLKKP